MSLFIFIAFALAQAQSKTQKQPPFAGHYKTFDPFSKYGVTYVGAFTPEEKMEVDNQLARTADLTKRYKEGKIMDVYLLGREYFAEYRKQKAICSTSVINWSNFGEIFSQAALRLGHTEEPIGVLAWLKRQPLRGVDDDGLSHALQGLLDLKHGDLAGAKKEVAHYDALVGNPKNGTPAPMPKTKDGVAALCYLGIDRYASSRWDLALEAQYDAFAVKYAPTNAFCYFQLGNALGLDHQYKESVTALSNGIKVTSGRGQWMLTWLRYGNSQSEVLAERQKKLGIKPNGGRGKP